MYSFSYLEPVCCSMSSSNCCFLTCILVENNHNFKMWWLWATSSSFESISNTYMSITPWYIWGLTYYHNAADALQNKNKSWLRRHFYGFLWWLSSKESICQCRRPGFNFWVRKIPQTRKWHAIPVFLPRLSHGQRNLVGYSPLGRKESDRTERLTHTYSCL